MGIKSVYIHFESKPALERLGKYFEKYPGYQKVFASSYIFEVPTSTLKSTLEDWTKACFPYDEYVLCFGSNYYCHHETALFSINTALPK